MSPRPDQSLIARVAKKLGEPASLEDGAEASILSSAGVRYGNTELTADEGVTTGFDPQVAALFEAIIESAYLVAHADGEFDDAEREAFQAVVLAACGGKVAEGRIAGLLTDLDALVAEDGIEKRVRMVARNIERRDQALEVLRVAALVAQVSEGVSDVERRVIDQLAAALSLEPEVVASTLSDVERAFKD